MDLRQALRNAMQQGARGSGIVGGGIVGGAAAKKKRSKKALGGCYGDSDLEDMVKMYVHETLMGSGLVGGARGRPLGSKNRFPKGKTPKKPKKQIRPELLPYTLANKAIRGTKFTDSAAKSDVVCVLAGLYNEQLQDEPNMWAMLSGLENLKEDYPEYFIYKPRKRRQMQPDIIE